VLPAKDVSDFIRNVDQLALTSVCMDLAVERFTFGIKNLIISWHHAGKCWKVFERKANSRNSLLSWNQDHPLLLMLIVNYQYLHAIWWNLRSKLVPILYLMPKFNFQIIFYLLVGTLYDALSVTRLYSVDKVGSEWWWWINVDKHQRLKRDSNRRSQHPIEQFLCLRTRQMGPAIFYYIIKFHSLYICKYQYSVVMV
jgi:hypothetical protein